MIILYSLLGFVLGAPINALADALPLHRPLAVPAYLRRQGPLRFREAAVHAAGAVLFALLWARLGTQPVPAVLLSFYTLVLLLVTVTDLEHKRIPDKAILPAIVIAVLGAPLRFGDGWGLALLAGLIGFLFFYAAYWLGNRVWGRGALGWGDVKLAAFVGLISGFPQVFVALIVGLFAGGLIGALLLLTRRVSLRTAIPYGPFIVIGGFCAMVWGTEIILWYGGQFSGGG
ncbi:MAG TPA: A24 family peptidase [Anaerolineae bacterium]